MKKYILLWVSIILILLWICIAIFVYLTKNAYIKNINLDDYEIPENVTYIRISVEENEEVARLTKDALNKNKVLPSWDMLVVGPTIWKEYANNPLLNVAWKDTSGIIDWKVFPMRTYLTKDDCNRFLSELQKNIAKQKGIVRKANWTELSYYWSTIPFDIEEPLFILDLWAVQYLLNFNKEREIIWIDKIPENGKIK